MKDLHNIAMASKMPSTTETSASEVQDLADWLKEKYAGIYCEFATNKKLELTGIYIQDAEMKSTFDRFPEVILADSTYKANNLNMALCALLAVDGHGESQVIFVTSEDKTTLTDMLNRFKECNPRWDDVSTVITDKDITERA